MRELDEDELEQLVASQRHVQIAGWTLIGLIVLGLVVFLATAPPDSSSGGSAFTATGGIGILLGSLITLPQRALIKRLGLTRVEAISILAAEQERRSPRKVLSLDVIRRKRNLRYAVAAVGFLAVVVALAYAIPVGGQVHPEGAPEDPVFVTSVIAVPVGLFVGILALVAGQAYNVALKARSAAT